MTTLKDRITEAMKRETAMEQLAELRRVIPINGVPHFVGFDLAAAESLSVVQHFMVSEDGHFWPIDDPHIEPPIDETQRHPEDAAQ